MGVVLLEGLEMANRTTFSGMNIGSALSLYGTAPIYLPQLPGAAHSWRGPSGVLGAWVLLGMLPEFSPYWFVIFTSGRWMWESMSLKAGEPHEHVLLRKPALEPTPCLLHCSLSMFQCEEPWFVSAE